MTETDASMAKDLMMDVITRDVIKMDAMRDPITTDPIEVGMDWQMMVFMAELDVLVDPETSVVHVNLKWVDVNHVNPLNPIMKKLMSMKLVILIITKNL
jgi:hypothetical protein